MAWIEFEATNANLFVSRDEFGEKRHLSFGVQLPIGESIALTTGEDFRKLDARVTVVPDLGNPPPHSECYWPVFLL